MNYLCSYWLSPNASRAREVQLRRYFDLQCYLKQRMGCRQVIMTNIDYPGSISIDLPPNFTEEKAFFTRYFALKQQIEAGLEFPICLHDHDLFNAKPLPHDADAILVGSMKEGAFSEQAVVYPSIAKHAIFKFSDILWNQDIGSHRRAAYGAKRRHEGMFSTEQTIHDLVLRPFRSVPMRIAFNVKDQVSFDIGGQNSLDTGDAMCADIPPGVDAIHGHINKGQATDVLLDWLARELCQ